MSNARFHYTNDAGVEFVWHGGEYIDVGATVDGEFQANDCINVWNHAEDVPEIPRTLGAFEAECDRWLREQLGEDEDVEDCDDGTCGSCEYCLENE